MLDHPPDLCHAGPAEGALRTALATGLPMTSGHLFIATSLDGFVARKDRQIDWLEKQPMADEDHGYDAFVELVDGIVMGRGTFETVRAYEPWPYQKPVVVMSGSLGQGDIPAALRGRVTVSDLSPAALMDDLAARGWERAYIEGGALVQSFLREGLIRDIVLTVAPVLIGDGIRLFGALDFDIDLELVGATAFPSGLVQSRYRIRTLSDML